MTFNKNRAGQRLQMVNGEIWTPKDGVFITTVAVLDSGTYARVTLTGWSVQGNNGVTFWQTTSGGYIDLAAGWVYVGQSTGYSARTVQSYVNEIINNNQIILQNNLVCARFANKLTASQRNQIRALQNRLQARNDSLLNDGLVVVKETSYPRGFADLAPALQSIMQGTSGVGSAVGVVVATWVVIVTVALIVTSAVTAGYFAYRAYAAESKQDVKFSKELTKTLTSKLTTEEWEQLKQETSGLVTKATFRQSILQGLGTTGSLFLVGGAVVLGLWIRNKYFKKG